MERSKIGKEKSEERLKEGFLPKGQNVKREMKERG